jgi:DNA polymerase-3 subunit gamma/tau
VALALARKYRPRTFGEVAVQTHVATTLKGAIARGRVASGYLLCGPRGTGKTTLARVLAMALNCERKRVDGEPCGECGSCTRIWAGATSLDVVEIDAASNRGVDDARDLRERAMYAPSGDDRYKVYIIDEAHMLTREAWNALLKVLEEPAPRVVFVFATTEPQKIQQAAAPVLSRLQRFDLKRIGVAEIRARVGAILEQERVTIEPDALAMLARAADGSMRDALSLADQLLAFGDDSITAEAVRTSLGLVAEDELVALLDLIAERRAGEVFAVTARLADFGVDFSLLLAGVADILRAQLAIELGGALPEMTERLRTALEERKGRLPASDLVRMLSLLVEYEPVFRKSAQQQMLFEALMVRFALLDRTMEIEDVLRALGSGESGGDDGHSGRQQNGGAGGVGAGGGGSARAPGRTLRDSAVREHSRDAPPQRAPRESVSPRAQHSTGSPPVPRENAPLADAPSKTTQVDTLDLNRLAERWDDIAGEFRASGRELIAQLLDDSVPSAVTGDGVITLETESPIIASGLAEVEAVVLDAIRRHFKGVRKLVARASANAPARRYDAKMVKEERVAAYRRDPLLAAAIDALDLELME